ncbi:MAG TPA: hypothetical protein VN442_25905 [Bryobacteraceae bacterium]|nr:hypothetical protein [Bryobacteraceae bacterium]
MKVHVAVALGLFAGIAGAQPSINSGGVVNAASYANPAMPNGGIAQGSMFVVFGKNLGPASIVLAGPYPLTTSVGETSIQVTVGATTVNALIVYSVSTQVAAILPSNTPTGPGKVTLRYGGASSAQADIQVVPASFGIFARNQAGSGPAIVQNWVGDGTVPVNAVFDAAHRGQTMILWGTGLGPATGNDAQPTNQATPLDTPVEVIIGSKRAQVTYKGRSPQFAGVDQINFVIPQDVELGCYVPLAVRAGTVTSNFTSLAIAASGKACSESVTGYSAADLEAAIARGSVRIGSISLSRTRMQLGLSIPIPGAPTDIKTDSGSATFMRYDATTLAASSTAFGSVTPYGSCSVFNFSGSTPGIVDPVLPTGLDAGTLTVSGQKGLKQLDMKAKGVYSATLGGGGISIPGLPGGTGQPEYLDAGSYTISNGAGGTDVGSFSATLVVPAPLVWLKSDEISTVDRTKGLTVTWSGGGANQFVTILGASVVGENGAAFVCTENATRGTFTVEPAVLSALPRSQVSDGVATGILALTTGSAGQGGKFQATGLDFGYVTYTDMNMKTVNYQ